MNELVKSLLDQNTIEISKMNDEYAKFMAFKNQYNDLAEKSQAEDTVEYDEAMHEIAKSRNVHQNAYLQLEAQIRNRTEKQIRGALNGEFWTAIRGMRK